MKYEQSRIPEPKYQVRLTIDRAVVRLAKSKAAIDEQSLSAVVEALLRKWLKEGVIK